MKHFIIKFKTGCEFDILVVVCLWIFVFKKSFVQIFVVFHIQVSPSRNNLQNFVSHNISKSQYFNISKTVCHSILLLLSNLLLYEVSIRTDYGQRNKKITIRQKSVFFACLWFLNSSLIVYRTVFDFFHSYFTND